MDGMLSQDEISALLSGMDLSLDSDAEASGNQEANTSAEESGAAGSMVSSAAPTADESLLTEVERDAIGEVANISMGSSATTLYSLVNKKVNITTPVVTMATWESLMGDYERPCVFIQIKYTQGLDGSNILVLKEQDVKVITDLMMGGDGSDTGDELGDLHLSAISEAMNQMMGSAATSLSQLLATTIDISPPQSSLLDLNEVEDGSTIEPFLGGTFVKIAFRMQIGDLVDSTIMQLYPVEFARRVVNTFIGSHETETSSEPKQSAGQGDVTGAAPAGNGLPGGMQQGAAPGGMNPMGAMPQGMGENAMYANGMNPMAGAGMNPMYVNGMNPMAGMGMAPMGGMNPMMNPMMAPMGGMQQAMPNVNVQPAQFQNFSNDLAKIPGQENIGLIMDVPLEVTVELGRTVKSISEILEFAPGTIIELDRIAGEPIDVLVNGKFVAKGEVVVIEESFGVRVTEIIK